MKLNWLGKAFFGLAGAYAVGKVLEGSNCSSNEVEFSNAEIEALAKAYKAGNYPRFTSIYRTQRPWADDTNVATTWGLFGQILSK